MEKNEVFARGRIGVGFIVSGLNHLAHLVIDGGIEVDKETKNNLKKWLKQKL